MKNLIIALIAILVVGGGFLFFKSKDVEEVVNTIDSQVQDDTYSKETVVNSDKKFTNGSCEEILTLNEIKKYINVVQETKMDPNSGDGCSQIFSTASPDGKFLAGAISISKEFVYVEKPYIESSIKTACDAYSQYSRQSAKISKDTYGLGDGNYSVCVGENYVSFFKSNHLVFITVMTNMDIPKGSALNIAKLSSSRI